MSILTRVLIGLVVVSVFPLIYFSAAVLRLHEAWQSKEQKYVAAVAKAEAEVLERRIGDEKNFGRPYDPGRLPDGRPGVDAVQVARDNLMLGRGRVWYAKRTASSVDTTTGTFKITLVKDPLSGDQPENLEAHGIADKAFLYIFQLRHNQTEDGAFPASDDRYVGEFVVTGLDANAPADVTLRPAVPYANDVQWGELQSGSGEWIVYEHMPIDDHAAFSNWTEERIRALLPAAVAAEYVYDDKPPTDEVLNDEKLKDYVVVDPNNSNVKKFLRPLRDYQQIFRNMALRMTAINDRLKFLEGEKAYGEAAKAQMEEQIAKLDARKAALDEEKARVEAEFALIQAQSEKVNAALTQARQELQAKLAENRQLADQLAGQQKTAALVPLDAAASTP